MNAKKKPSTQRIRAKSQKLRRLIGRMDFVASGTIHVRTKVCGRKNCKCATDPEQRHGPYHEWTRSKDGKLQHRVVSSDQARLLQRAISNYREIQSLLARWEDETASEILNPKPEDPKK
ncbi:MAG TPA: DUF6788 family protein [Anaerolineae bacterium]|jgi:hypothetical protein|nr:DUF6788 family protein [Anaerolineae bacterium]